MITRQEYRDVLEAIHAALDYDGPVSAAYVRGVLGGALQYDAPPQDVVATLREEAGR